MGEYGDKIGEVGPVFDCVCDKEYMRFFSQSYSGI